MADSLLSSNDCQKRLVEKRRHWLLLVSQLGSQRIEGECKRERAEFIRCASKIVSLPVAGADDDAFRGQALLCIARALAAEAESGEPLEALEQSFLDVLEDKPRLPILVTFLSSREQARFASQALLRGMGTGFADACHRALLTADTPDPSPLAAALRAAAALLKAGVWPRAPALVNCIAQRAALVAAGIDTEGCDEEQQAACDLIQELLRAEPRQVLPSLIDSLQEQVTRGALLPEATLANVQGLTAQGRAYARLCEGILDEASCASARASTALAVSAPGLAVDQWHALAGKLANLDDESLRHTLLYCFRRLLTCFQGPREEPNVQNCLLQAPTSCEEWWSWLQKNRSTSSSSAPTGLALTEGIMVCAELLEIAWKQAATKEASCKARFSRLSASRSSIGCHSWSQAIFAPHPTGVEAPPLKRRRLIKDSTLAIQEVELLMACGSETPARCLSMICLVLEVCNILSNDEKLQESYTLLLAAFQWLQTSLQGWDAGQGHLESSFRHYIRYHVHRRLGVVIRSWCKNKGDSYIRQLLESLLVMRGTRPTPLASNLWTLDGQWRLTLLQAVAKDAPHVLGEVRWPECGQLKRSIQDPWCWQPWPTATTELATRWWQALLHSGAASLHWQQEVLRRWGDYMSFCHRKHAPGRTFHALFKLAALAASQGISNDAHRLLAEGKLGTCPASDDQQNILVQLGSLVAPGSVFAFEDTTEKLDSLLERSVDVMRRLRGCCSSAVHPQSRDGLRMHLKLAEEELGRLACMPLLPAPSGAAFRCRGFLATALRLALEEKAGTGDLAKSVKLLQEACMSASALAGARLRGRLKQPGNREFLLSNASRLEEVLPVPRAIFGVLRDLHIELEAGTTCIDEEALRAPESFGSSRWLLRVQGQPVGLRRFGAQRARAFQDAWSVTQLAVKWQVHSDKELQVLDSWSVRRGRVPWSATSCMLQASFSTQRILAMPAVAGKIRVEAELQDPAGQCLALGHSTLDLDKNAWHC